MPRGPRKDGWTPVNTSRRNILGAALVAPLMAQFADSASAAPAAAALGKVSDAWLEVRWTPEAQTVLDQFQAKVEAVAPAQLVTDAKGSAVRFPVRVGQGEPSLTNPAAAHGDGGLDGGVTVRTPDGSAQLTGLTGLLKDGQASGKAIVNGVEVGHPAVCRAGLAEGVLTTDPALPGQPTKIRVTDVPLRPTPELVQVYTATFGDPPFTTDTVLAHVSGEGLYTPTTI